VLGAVVDELGCVELLGGAVVEPGDDDPGIGAIRDASAVGEHRHAVVGQLFAESPLLGGQGHDGVTPAPVQQRTDPLGPPAGPHCHRSNASEHRDLTGNQLGVSHGRLVVNAATTLGPG